MKEYNQKLKAEISQFREVGHKFLKKEISVAEFKGISGGMGVYAQRGGEKFMIRLRIPSGVLTFAHLKLITGFAKKYQLKSIHLTTRQAIQLHELDIDPLCDIMETAINHGLYTRGAGGNFPRNVTLSPLSGVEIGEAFDVTPYALLAGNYLMERITKYHLPRKLKIAFSNSDEDWANSTINDLGFLAVIHNGKPYFKLYIAGGLGNNPAVALPFDELVDPKDILYHVEAVTRVFCAEGDYENKGKARLRYIPRRMGTEGFINCYKKHLLEVKSTLALEEIPLDIPVEMPDQAVPITTTVAGLDESNNLIPQKQKGQYTVVLHPLSGIMPTEALIKLITFLEICENVDIRLTMTESMYIRGLDLTKATQLLELTKEFRQADKVSMSVSCIGVPTCQIGIEQSQDLLKSILKTLKENQTPQEYLPSVHISGCNNSCARHQVSAMGFAGSKKRIGDSVEDVFELHIGGSFYKDNTKMGKVVGIIKKDEIPIFMNELAISLYKCKKDFILYLKENREEFDALVKPYLV